MNKAQYDEWMSLQIQDLVHTLVAGDKDLSSVLEQVKRGIDYGEQHPDEMSRILIDIGRSVYRTVKEYISSTQAPQTPQSPIFNIPGQEVIKSVDMPGDAGLDVNELKNALQSRKKKKVQDKMMGSLDSLKDFNGD
ncbi:MAG: hypothetical protein ACTSP4_03870 [Candidatus Hodarchaeales archaeon]